MSPFFLILIVLAMLAVLASLFAGLFVMARGGAMDKKYSNRLMRARVMLQGLAVLLFVIAIAMNGK